MKLLKHSIGMMALSLISASAHAAPFGLEARSLAMGNASVVTADIATAALANPAMLAHQKGRDDFALLLPAVGILVDDSEGVIDLIDEFQASTVPADQLNILNQLTGKEVSPQFGVASAIGFSGDTYAFAVSVRQDVVGLASITNTGDPTTSTLDLGGVRTTEIGVSIARNFNLMGRKVSVGLTPKIVDVESFSSTQLLTALDTGDLINNETDFDEGSYSTLDAGIVIEITNNLQIGAVARNLLSDELNGLEFDTEIKAGIAYTGDFFTIAADLDMNENNTGNNTSFSGADSRILSVGAEFNALDFVQLRVGMQKNIASDVLDSDKDALLTAGVGFWFGFHLDAAVIAGDDVLGAFIQTGFRF